MEEEVKEFKADVLALFKKHGIGSNHFVEICTACGSPITRVQVWNPEYFSRACLERGFSALFPMERIPPQVDLQWLRKEGLWK